MIVNAIPVTGRHRVGYVQRPWTMRPPQHFRPVSHRRSRRVALQRPVAELVRWPYATTRQPWWVRAARFAGAWVANVVEPSR